MGTSESIDSSIESCLKRGSSPQNSRESCKRKLHGRKGELGNGDEITCSANVDPRNSTTAYTFYK